MNKKVITISLEALISLAIILFSLHLTPVFANEEVIKDVVSGHIKGEIVIDFKDNIDENSEAFHKIITDYKIRPYYNSAYSKDSKLMLADVDEQHMDEILQALNKESFVESAEPNYVMFSFKAPNDPLYKYQWNMKKINLPAAWKYSTGKNVTVAVIDTGIAHENYGGFHRLQDLSQTKFVSPYNFVNNSEHANDDNGHGSHVAGTIAQTTNNGKGVVGIAYNASLMPIKVLNRSGQGRSSDIADAIRYAADKKAKIINLSLGSPFNSKIMEDACKYAASKGVLIVCAAGNDNSKKPTYPAGYKECISVSAIRDDNALTFYSNKYKDNFIAAPGGDMKVDQNGDGYMDGILQNTIKDGNPEKEDYILFQGTSMAAPHVSGVAALMMSRGCKNPATIKKILQKTAYKKNLKLEDGYGAGILDAGKAMSYVCGDKEQIFSQETGCAKKTGTGSLIKLISLIAVTMFFRKKLKNTVKNPGFTSSAIFIIGLIIGGCGLFLIPNQLKENSTAFRLLAESITEWHTILLPCFAYAAFIFQSAAIPVLMMFISMPFKLLKRLATGISVGTASALLASCFTANSGMAAIPIPLHLKAAWFIINAFICLFIAYGMIKYVPDPKNTKI